MPAISRLRFGSLALCHPLLYRLTTICLFATALNWAGGSSVLFAGENRQSEQNNSEASAKRPVNIVLFFIDDLGYKDLGCYGSDFYETPHIDALAKRGVRFTDFYSANPVCSPTRVALMTGKAPQRLGITQWLKQPSDLHLPLDEITIGEAFSEAGYQTGYIGKWHLGDGDDHQPSDQGFDWTRCVNRAGQPASYYFPYQKPKRPFHNVPDLEDGKKGDYLTDRMTDKALEFVNIHREKPFFLCFSHYAMHTPIEPPSALAAKYKQRLDDDVQPGKPATIAERNGAKSRAQQNNPGYAAMVENLDTNVGRVVDHLETLGLTENTIIVFASDNGGLSTTRNGGPTSCLPLRAGKGWTYEGGIRVPNIIVWPGKVKPAVCQTPGITMDIYPTLLELAGLDSRAEQHLDGQSLVSALGGEPSEVLTSRFLAWTYPHHHGSQHTPSNAIRMGDWKLIHRIDDETKPADEFELYHLADDIGEQTNLAARHPDRAQAMSEQLRQWLASTTPEETP